MTNGTRIKLSETHVNLVRHYATAALPKHEKFGRTDDEVWHDICRGKEGEIAYCLIHGIPLTALSFDVERNVDPGYDLIHNDIKIDVKTGTGSKIYFNPEYSGCDQYALMRYHFDTGEYEYLLSMDKYLAYRDARVENGAWFWDVSTKMK